MTTQPAGPARQPPGTRGGRHAAIVMIGLAMAGRIARDSRTYESVIVIAVAAVAGLGRTGGTQTFARLAAWDKQRTANALRALKARQP
jgi:ribosomal protein L3